MTGNKKDGQKNIVVTSKKGNQCPVKEGDNCKVPGVYGDSSPIGGS